MKGPLALLSRSRLFAIPARRTTTGPVETHRGGRRRSRPARSPVLVTSSGKGWVRLRRSRSNTSTPYCVLRIHAYCVLGVWGFGLHCVTYRTIVLRIAYYVLRLGCWRMRDVRFAYYVSCVLGLCRGSKRLVRKHFSPPPPTPTTPPDYLTQSRPSGTRGQKATAGIPLFAGRDRPHLRQLSSPRERVLGTCG